MDESYGNDSMASLKNARFQRRSRFETAGRDYKCQVCDKSYLSNPALYAHMKNKHAMEQLGQGGGTGVDGHAVLA